MKKRNKTISRRMFLKGTGGFSLVIPFLPSLLPREAWGQSIPTIKRYFSFVGDYDYGHHQHWFPTLDQLSQIHNPGNGDHQIRYQALRSFIANPNSELSYIFGNKLNPYLDKMNLIRGLNLHSRIAHGKGPMLGNIAANDGHDTEVVNLKQLPTIDQVLAANRRFTPYSLDPFTFGAYESFSYQKDAQGNVTRAPSRNSKPHELFDQLFTRNGQPIPENGSGGGNPAHPRRDALTRVFQDYQRVRNGTNISSRDIASLDSAMDKYSDLLNRLASTQTPGGAGCRYTNIDVSRTRTDGLASSSYSAENHKYAFELYARIFAAAASCDVHRVFNFHINNLQALYDRHPNEDFHQGHSHRPFEVVPTNNNTINHRHMAGIWREYVDSFVSKLVEHLDGSPDGDGKTILDNSLVHMTLENSTNHCDWSKPCLLIGGAGGALTTGHMIDYSRRELGPHPDQGDNFDANPNSSRFGHIYYGAHYNRSLTTILRAMGLNPNEYEDSSINGFFQGRSDGRIGSHNNGVTRVGGYGHIGSVNAGYHASNQELYNVQYSRYNYHFYKDSLPFPPMSSV